MYYGLTLNSGDLGGNPYVNNVIAGAVEVLAYVVGIWLPTRFGRIVSLVAHFFASGVVLLCF